MYKFVITNHLVLKTILSIKVYYTIYNKNARGNPKSLENPKNFLENYNESRLPIYFKNIFSYYLIFIVKYLIIAPKRRRKREKFWIFKLVI